MSKNKRRIVSKDKLKRGPIMIKMQKYAQMHSLISSLIPIQLMKIKVKTRAKKKTNSDNCYLRQMTRNQMNHKTKILNLWTQKRWT